MMGYQPMKPLTGNPVSTTLWQATAPAGPVLARLDGAIETDVLVIGGGIAGASTALHLAEAGVDVALLDADQPGSAATGQSGGLVAPDYIRHSPETIGATLGRAAGERLTKFLGKSAQQTFDLIARHRLDCDAYQDGFYTPAHTPTLAETQRLYAAQWYSRGFDVRFVEQAEAQRLLGTPAYCGALLFGQGGRLNPLAYVRGLAQAAVSAGAALYAVSPVEELVRTDGRWCARTRQGSVKARRLVLAANGGNARLHPAMRRTVLPLHVVEFATEPLSPAQRALVLPEGGSFTDKNAYVFSARLDGAGRLISAFPISLQVRGQAAYHREAKRRLAAYFASLGSPRIDFLWEGLAWINTSFLPEIYDLGDDALAIQACNGRGISTNTAIGIEIAQAWSGGDANALSIKPRQPSPIRMHVAARFMPKVLMSIAKFSN